MHRCFGQMGVVLREGVFALGLMALVLFSFGHQGLDVSPVDQADVQYAQVVLDWCGDDPSGDHEGHGPCHACRAAAADLPTPSGAFEAAFDCGANVQYVRAVSGPVLRPQLLSHGSRAPPIFA